MVAHVRPVLTYGFSQVLWSKNGVTAGIQGTTGVRALVRGLMQDDDGPSVELNGLPFEGSVLLGKKTL